MGPAVVRKAKRAMKTTLTALIVTVSVIALGAASVPVEAQPATPPLSSDLLFVPTITGGEVRFARNMILRVDAETLEVSPFYVDDKAWELMPVSWSPQGDLLVIYRMMPGDKPYSYSTSPRQLCILDRAGALQRCLEDGPPVHYAGRPEDWQHYYPVAWGPDGQTIFFDTEYPTEESPFGYGRRLVEASVLTGETRRVLYDYPGPYPVTLSPDLSHIAVGFGGQWKSNNPAYVLDLATGARLDVPDLVPHLTKLSWACLPFSPHGSYITIRSGYRLAVYAPTQEQTYDNGSLLLILDTQGTIQGTIGEPEGPDMLQYQDCPGWQPDEQAIVFYAYGYEQGAILRYSLPSQQLTTLYELKSWPERESAIYSPLIPSPDGAYVALTVSDNYYGGERLVAVLYPDGEIYRIPSPYRFGLYPLWVPPLNDPSPE
jgi:hypothetical protein